MTESTTEVYCEDVRLAFTDGLWEAKAGPDGGKPAFSVVLLFPKTHACLPLLSVAIQKAAVTKWNDKAAEILKSLQLENRLCVHDGNAKPQYPGYTGNLYMNARSFTAPVVVDRVFKLVDGKVVSGALTAQSGRPYSGCYGNVLVEVWAQSHPKGGKRINASLKVVQYLRDGDSFGGSRPPSPEQLARFGSLAVPQEEATSLTHLGTTPSTGAGLLGF